MSVRLFARSVVALLLAAVFLPLAASTAGAVLSYTVATTPPADLANGGPPEEFQGTATNNTVTPLANARYDFTISAPLGTGFDATDLTLEYEAAPDTWLPVPLTDCDTEDAEVVCGEFGPHTGFFLPSGTTTTNFRVASDDEAPVTTLTVESDLVTVDPVTGTPTQNLATDSDTIVLKAPTITFDLPDTLTKGADPVEFVGSVTNQTGSTYPAVRYQITIDGPDGLTADELTLQAEIADDSGDFVDIPLFDDGGVIVGVFPSQDGEPLPVGTDIDTTFRIAVAGSAPTGTVEATVDVVTVDEGNPTGTIATTSDTTEILGTDEVTLTFELPDDLAVGDGGEEFQGTLTNFTGEDIGAAELDFVITGPDGLTADDLVVEYLDGDTFVPLTLTDEDQGIVGSYGAPAGFPLPDGSQETATIRITALAGAPTGELDLSIDVVDLDGADQVVASASDSTLLKAPSMTLELPEDLTIGGAAEEGTLTVVNDTGSVYEAVRGEVVISGPDGFDSDDIEVEFDEPSTEEEDFQVVTLTDGDDDTVTASIPADGTPLLEGTTPITIRVTALPGAPVGTVTATVDLVTLDQEGDAIELALATATDSTDFETAAPVATTTVLVATPNPSRIGQLVTLTATVTRNSGSGAPTGTVTFKDGNTTLGSPVALNNGVATLQTAGLAMGDHVLSAVYTPGSGFATSTGTTNLRVTPATLTGRFVDQVYRLILGRPSDPGGLAYWSSRLDSGNLNRGSFVLVLIREPEVRNRNCDNLYRQTLNRSADATGLANCAEALRQGFSFRAIQAFLAGSPEFFQQAGSTNNGFIDLLYQRALGRSADQAGLASWNAFLAAGHTRLEVAANIYTSLERLGLFVDFSYAAFLGRGPDPSGRQYWVNRLQQGLLEEVLWADLVGSQEFLDNVP